MSNNNDDDNLIFIVLLLIGGGLIFLVWKFATAFGLDMTTAATVMWRMVVLCGITGVLWKFAEDTPFCLGNVWPILLAFLWVCWWPALDYWAAQQLPPGLTGEIEGPWWNAWYAKYGEFLGIAGLGYYIRSWVK